MSQWSRLSRCSHKLCMDLFISPAHLGASVVGYTAAYSGFKKTMAYLRGSTRPRAGVAISRAMIPTLPGRVKKLESQVNRNKAELQSYHLTTGLPAITAGRITHDITPAQTLRGTSFFRSLITGDKWMNHYLDFRFMTPNAALHGIRKIRVIMYWPRDADDVLNVSSYTAFPDPTRYKVVYDNTFVASSHQGPITRKLRFNLGKRLTWFDTTNDKFVKNLPKIRLIFDHTYSGSSTDVLDYSFNYWFSNK